MEENNYYRCTIRTQFEDAKGRMKSRKENYIVFAVSPTDAETKIAKHLEVTDYEVVSINLLNIIEIIK